MAYVKYDSNNSGGSWWLTDDNWRALEKAGWIVKWGHLTHVYTPQDDYVRDEQGVPKLIHIKDAPPSKYGSLAGGVPDENGLYRWLGALATEAYRPNCTSIREAAEEWERITGGCATDAGCACCGQPHTFALYDDNGKYVESGPHTSYEAAW